MNCLRAVSVAALLVATFGTFGCAYWANRRSAQSNRHTRPETYALAVSVQGGLQPSPTQWATIQAAFAKELAARGLVLVTDLSLADRIIRVDFTPSLDNPEEGGHAVIVSIRNNSLREMTTLPSPVLASSSRYPSSFGYTGSFQNSFSSFANNSYYGYGNSYYGYGNSYYDGYSYSTPTLNPRIPPPPPTTHPNPKHRHHPDHPGTGEKCPPLLSAKPRPSPPERVVYPPSDGGRPVFADDVRRYGGDRGSNRSERGERTYPPRTDSGYASTSRTGSDGTRSRTERTSSTGESRTWSRSDRVTQNSERTSSRSESGYSRSGGSYSRSEPSSSSSYSSSGSSASSYSPPSSSYSSGSSASSSSSSSSSSGGGGNLPVAATPSNTLER